MTVDKVAPETVAGAKPPRVFISYSHDSDEHKERVLQLAQQLRQNGIDARIDQFLHAGPPEGWPRWMQRQVEEADFVIVACTERYKRCFDGKGKPGKGLGSNWEGILLDQMLYEAGAVNEKFLPVLFEGMQGDEIPLPLRPFNRYRLPLEWEQLVRVLLGRPAVVPLPVGAPPDFKSRTGLGGSIGPLRQRIRDLLQTINPQVLERIDAGDAVRVMIAVPHEMQLFVLMSEAGFKDLLSVSPTSSSLVACVGCSIGGHLNDLLDGMNMNGYLLEPRQVLRRQPMDPAPGCASPGSSNVARTNSPIRDVLRALLLTVGSASTAEIADHCPEIPRSTVLGVLARNAHMLMSDQSSGRIIALRWNEDGAEVYDAAVGAKGPTLDALQGSGQGHPQKKFIRAMLRKARVLVANNYIRMSKQLQDQCLPENTRQPFVTLPEAAESLLKVEGFSELNLDLSELPGFLPWVE